MADDTKRRVAGRLRAAREKSNLTQQQVARYLGVSAAEVSYWESGGRRIDLVSLSKLADLFGYPVSWFLDFPDARPDQPMAVSYRAEELSDDDLKTVAWAIQFAKNLDLLHGLLEGRDE